jgi:tripartite-type tricarboxylate transporter receptor subunit TctC
MKFKKQTIIGLFISLLVALSMTTTLVSAADWKPQKPIRLIATDSPGSPYDSEARIIANEMAKMFNRPVIVDNVVGGGMMMGAITTYRAKPDGYTIAMTSSIALIINQIFQEAKYDLNRFAYLGQVANSARVPNSVVATAGKGIDTWESILKLDRPFRWGTIGKGTITYVSAKAISQVFGFKDPVFITTYTGGDLLLAVVRGECDGTCFLWDLVEPFIKSGDLKLVLTGGNKRFQNYDVPCVGELGHPELDKVTTNYRVIIGPPDLPRNIYNVLSNAVFKATTSDTMKEYHMRAVAKGAYYEPAPGDVTRENVMGCLEVVRSMAPYLK